MHLQKTVAMTRLKCKAGAKGISRMRLRRLKTLRCNDLRATQHDRSSSCSKSHVAVVQQAVAAVQHAGDQPDQVGPKNDLHIRLCDKEL